MHELSIAEAIVRIAAANAGDRRVSKVELKVGHLRQVVPSALEFAFELVAQGTPVEGAALEIEEVSAAGVCRGCGRENALAEFPFRCSRCGGLDFEVTRGEELLVEALELEEALTTTGGTR
ncbi:MAG TPA: hydrogenase maturation nickel metallochaperone HypA [Thermoleophilaceae bacterium]